MTPHTVDVIRDEKLEDDFALFLKVRNAVRQLPDLDLGYKDTQEKIILSCHMLARATARVFPSLIVEDGWYAKWPHSWLITPRRQFIDVYPIGLLSDEQGGPIYVHCVIARMLYRTKYEHPEDGRIITGDFSGDEYLLGKVKIIAEELEKYTS